MRTKATLFGHPLHPVLIAIPIGAFPTALVLDVLHVWTGDRAWWLAAFAATAFGLVVLVAAVVPGFIDYRWSVPRQGAVWKKATVHMWLGIALFLVFAVSTLLRWVTLGSPGTPAAWAALGLGALGNVGLLVQGYLGGELRGRHLLGVDTGPERHGPTSAPETEPEARGSGQAWRRPH